MASGINKTLEKINQRLARLEGGGNRTSVRGRSPSRQRNPSRKRSQSRKRQNQAGTSMPAHVKMGGSCRFQKTETLIEPATAADKDVQSGSVKLSPSDVDFKAGYFIAMSKLFDMMRWHKLVIRWVPELGSTRDGSITFGIDWDGISPTEVNQATVQACSPTKTTKVVEAAHMGVPASRYQDKRWLKHHDKEVLGSLLYFAKGPKGMSLGYFVIDYDIEFQGTRMP